MFYILSLCLFDIFVVILTTCIFDCLFVLFPLTLRSHIKFGLTICQNSTYRFVLCNRAFAIIFILQECGFKEEKMHNNGSSCCIITESMRMV